MITGATTWQIHYQLAVISLKIYSFNLIKSCVTPVQKPLFEIQSQWVHPSQTWTDKGCSRWAVHVSSLDFGIRSPVAPVHLSIGQQKIKYSNIILLDILDFFAVGSNRLGPYNTRLPYKLQVLPYKTGTSFKHVFADENVPLSSPLVVFSTFLSCYLAVMSSITALGLSKPDVMRLNLYDPSNRDTSILLVR